MEYNKSVFINCPFDDLFAPLLHAIVLTVLGLGFEPRSARETEGEAEPRIGRIARGLRESKYSIHDLSRFQGEGADNLARFNMPLELGMALALRYERTSVGTSHNWLALVPTGFVHQKFISDLSGFDPPGHDGTAASLIKAVALWLSLQSDYALPTPSAKSILDEYERFEEALEKAKTEALGVLSWPVLLRYATATVKSLPVR